MTDRSACASGFRRGVSYRPPLALLCLLFLAMGMCAAAASPPAQDAPRAAGADSLWQRAVELVGRNAWWIPGIMITRFEELDGHGQTKSAEETTLRIFLGPEGQPDSEIVSAFEDQKDVTEKARQEAAEKKRKAAKQRRKEEEKRRKEREKRGEPPEEPADDREGFSLRAGGATPFDPEVQDSVRVHRIVAEDPPPGGPFVAYEFSRDLGDEKQLVGTAWLDAETGAPAELRFAPDPLPGRVKELAMRMRFAADSSGAWYPVEMRIEGMGKFLFFKKRFRSTMLFSDPWWCEAGQDDGTPPPREALR